jgi:hypothetical protein
MLKTSLLLGLLTAAFSGVAAQKPDLSKIDTSKLPPSAKRDGVTYEKDIHPMLQASCVRCHGQDRPKAGLRLDSLDGALKGSKDGKVVVPGESQKSLLLIAASQIDEDTAMPPKHRPGRGGPGGGPGGPPTGGQQPGATPGAPRPGGPPGPGGRGNFGPPPKPLTTEQVSLLRAWIEQGAK